MNELTVRRPGDRAAEEARIRDAYARRGLPAHESWFNPAYRYMLQQQERRMLPLLTRHGFERLDNVRVLEVGCGTGQWLRNFVRWGAEPEHMVGVDLLPDRLDIAKELSPPGITFECGSAAALDFADGSFDLVFQSTVFTSILDADMRRAVASEMRRVVRVTGMILWYDYYMDNPANRDVRGIRKAVILELFPDCCIELKRVTLAPPIGRLVAPCSTLACELLEKIPLLRTHYLGAIRPLRPYQP